MGRGLSKAATYRRILEYIHRHPEDATLPAIRKALGLSPQLLNYYVRRLERMGYIEVIRAYPRILRITPAGKKALYNGELKESTGRQSGRPTPSIRLHAVQVVIPVIKKGKEIGGKDVKMKGWARKILDTNIPDVTAECYEADGKPYIRLFIHDLIAPRTAQGLVELQNMLTRILYVANAYFTKRGWLLDIFHVKEIHRHIENQLPEYEDKAEGHVTVTLPRKARSFLTGEETDHQAHAWLDRSKGPLGVESDDRLYEERLILMPETVDRIDKVVTALAADTAPLLRQLHDDLGMHLEAVQQIAMGQTTLNKLLHRMNLLLEKLDRRLSE